MINFRSLAVLFGSIMVLVAANQATPAAAQATRTWVSGVGDDANPCSRTAPCKTFAGAISKTATGGEINCLDPGGFGAVTITKSITLECSHTLGGILSLNVNGVIINATATSVVILRGLDINGALGTVGNGVRILAAGTVIVDNCRIYGFQGTGTNGRGVAIDSTGTLSVTIQNSQFYNNNLFGIHSNPTSGFVTLAVDNTQLTRSGTAIDLRNSTQAAINRTSAINNQGAGLASELGLVSANVSNSNFSNNAQGVINGNGGAPTMRLYSTVITGNTVAGLQIGAGSVISLGNNMIQGNAGNQAPSSTITTQ
jgi:hypothetical protein